MGCDIHFYVERKDGDEWISADTWEQSEYGPSILYEKRFYNSRNYDLFAILADVRNGRGFAGIDTGDGFNPIAPCRGLPDDVSPQVAAEHERWDGDGHSHSWFTVKELMDYDWTQIAIHRGYVTFPVYEKFKRLQKWDQSPEEVCGNVSGGSTVKLPESAFANKLDELKQSPWSDTVINAAFTDRTYAKIEWPEPYWHCCRNFLHETMPKLWRIGSPEDVRAVFWFDN